MAKLIDFLKEILQDRITNPLTISFVISWCLWNYKFIIILFSENSASTTFHLVGEFSFKNNYDYLFKGLLFPLFSSLLYIFFYPFPSKLVYSYFLKRNLEIKSIKNTIENSRVLTLEESQNLRSFYTKERINLIETITNRDAEIHALRAEIQKLNDLNYPTPEVEKEKESKTNKNVESEINKDNLFKKDAIKILKEIISQSSQNNYFIPSKIDTIIASSDSAKFKSLIAYLENLNLIRFDSKTSDGQPRYQITNQGLMEVGKQFYEPID